MQVPEGQVPKGQLSTITDKYQSYKHSYGATFIGSAKEITFHTVNILAVFTFCLLRSANN